MPVGVSNLNREAMKFTIYPNPASTSITISYQAEQDKHNCLLRLYNTMGQLLKSENVSGNSMQEDVSALPNGIYYYTLLVDGVVVATNKFATIR